MRYQKPNYIHQGRIGYFSVYRKSYDLTKINNYLALQFRYL